VKLKVDSVQYESKRLFETLGIEFKHLHTSVSILIENYRSNFLVHEDALKVKIKQMKDSGEFDKIIASAFFSDITHGEIVENQLERGFYPELATFSSIIIGSMLVKYLAYIEKLLITLSLIVQKKEKEKVGPNFYSNTPFTDMLKAVEYISLITNREFNIKKSKHWSIITHLRAVRHKLAHGENVFELEDVKVKEINKKIDIIDIISERTATSGAKVLTMYKCSIKTEIDKLLVLDAICIEFINDIKNKYTEKYGVE